MPIDRKELEDKIQQYLDGVPDGAPGEIYCTPHENARDELANFVLWLFKADIEKEERRQQYLKLKEEFEPEKPAIAKYAIHWMTREDKVLVALVDSAPPVVGMVIPKGEGMWEAVRMNPNGTRKDSIELEYLNNAKTWAVGHL